MLKSKYMIVQSKYIIMSVKTTYKNFITPWPHGTYISSILNWYLVRHYKNPDSTICSVRLILFIILMYHYKYFYDEWLSDIMVILILKSSLKIILLRSRHNNLIHYLLTPNFHIRVPCMSFFDSRRLRVNLIFVHCFISD